jgi:sodium/potassium/calcium exchanger 6
MLNILLGIGGAGTYVILATGHAYVVHFSSTLWVSAIGLITLLLATMCFVPYNGYWITKKWAVFLLSSYCLITILNIIVETHTIRL